MPVGLQLRTNATFAGANSIAFSGTTTSINNSDRTLTNNIAGGTLGLLGNVSLSDNATTGHTLTLAGSGNTTVSGTIANYSTGAGGLTVTNTGTTTLSGQSVFTGAFSQTGAGTVSLTGTMNGPSGITLNNASAVFNESSTGAIQSGSFTLSAGSAILSGSNSYAGRSTIAGGTLQLNSANAVGGGGITFKGGTLLYTTATADWSGQFKNSTSAIALNLNSQSVALGGVIDSSNNGGLSVSGSGTLTLSGRNSFSGTTTLPMGNTLVLGNKNALGAGTLTVSLPTNTSGSATLQAAVDLSGANAIANAVNANSAGGNATWEISGSNNITLAGNVSVTNSDVLMKNDLGGGAGLVISGSIVPNPGRYFIFAGSGSTTVSGNIGTSNGLIVSTTGVVTLSGSTAPQGTFGDFTLQAGTLVLGSPTASSTGRIKLSGGTLQAGIDLSGTNGLPNSAILLLADSAVGGTNNLTFNAPLTNNWYRTLSSSIGAGKTLTLAGNVYLSDAAASGYVLNLAGSGNTVVSGTIANNSAISGTAGSLSVTNTGTTTLSGQSVFTGAFSQTGAGAVSLTGTMNGPASVTVNNAGAVFTVSATGAIQGASTTLTVSSGKAILLGANSYGGATTVNGILQLGDGTAGHDPTLATSGIANNAQLRFNYYADQTIGSLFSGNGAIWEQGPGSLTMTGSNSAGSVSILSGTLQVGDGTSSHDGPFTATSISNNGALVYNLYGSGTLAAPISQSGALVKSGPGTLILTGSNSYTGATTIAGGTLQLNDSSIATTSGVLNNGVFAVNANTNPQTYSCAISGSGALVKGGASTLTLTGSNSYTGATTINGGTLQLGDGTTSGFIDSTSGIVNSGVLAYYFGTANRTLPSGISGSGSLVAR